MGLIHIDLFTSLDFVAQAPGGPEEDTSNGFQFGGWQAPFADQTVGEEVMGGISTLDALLLGRKTYDIFASYWPNVDDPGVPNEIAEPFNRIPKYVATRGSQDLPWNNSIRLGSDLAAEIQAIRNRHDNTHVSGSLDFVQTLLREQLFDRLNLWVYPILLGEGKKVFDGGSVPTNLSLIDTSRITPTGVLCLHYDRNKGVPATGDMSQPDSGT